MWYCTGNVPGWFLDMKCRNFWECVLSVFFPRAVRHLLEVLRPHSQECSGPLRVEHISYVEQRGNLMVEYSPDGAKGHIAIMGSHLDVVPANPLTWNWDPFKLTVEVS